MKIKVLFTNSKIFAELLVLIGIFTIIVSFYLSITTSTRETILILGYTSLIMGFMLLSFSKGEIPDPKFVSLLPMEGNSGYYDISTDLGFDTPAYFIPVKEDPKNRVLQFNSFTSSPAKQLPLKGNPTSFRKNGVITHPAGHSVLRMMEDEFDLIIPKDRGSIPEVIREVAEDLLGIAEKVNFSQSIDEVSVELKKFSFAERCGAFVKEDPKSCIVNPCPVCGTLACILATGLQKPCKISGLSGENRTLKVQFKL